MLAIIPTRGNLTSAQMDAILKPLFGRVERVSIIDNSQGIDLKLFAVYVHGGASRESLIYTQDDDVVISNPLDVWSYIEPGKIVCNMPQEFQKAYADKPDRLMGFGSCFERSLIRPTFERYLKYFPMDAVLLREAHRIFTALNRERVVMVDVPKVNMPYASDPDRLWRQPDHVAMHQEALSRVQFILKGKSK